MPKTNNPLTKRSGSSINVLLTVVVVVVAVVVIGGVLWFSGDKKQAASPDQTVPAEVLNPPDANTVSKSPDGKVTLTEFLDYQCPSCHQSYQALTKDLEQKYEGRITFVPRNYPLEQAHPLAMLAAHASEAAAAQGKYEQMYHALNEHWQEWAIDSPDAQQVSSNQQRAEQMFTGYAQQMGLDVNKFKQDLNSPEIAAKVKRDMADGDKAGVTGTPSMFLNGKKFEPKTAQEASQQIDGLLAK